MINTNTNWDTQNAALAKMPIYALQLGGAVYTTHELNNVGVTGAPSHSPWLQTPQGPSQEIDVVNGTSTIGEMTCTIVDKGRAMTAICGGTTLEGGTAELLVGYPGMAWTDFVTLHRYRVYKTLPVEGYGAWQIVSRDFQIGAKKTIYNHPENGGRISETNPWYFGGSPVECALAMLLFALGLDQTTVDVAGWRTMEAAVEGLYRGARPFFFAITEPLGVKQFLETEVFKIAGLYPVIGNTGLVGARSFRPPAAGPVPVFDFNQSNMTSYPRIDRLPVINEVVCKLDYDGSGYQTTLQFVQADSLGTFGRTTQFVIESKGLRSELGAQWFCQYVAHRIFRRFAGTPEGLRGGAPVVEVDAFLMTLPVWVGDFVTLTHPLMPDIITGATGVTGRVFEVVGRTPDYAGGRMAYKLLDTGLTGLPAAYQWGASSSRPFVIGTSEIY